MTTRPKRPNVLLFITDQQRADHLGCYGNPVLRTPHIDTLAARGTRADKFYVASTTCMSNRATLMTGRMPSLHGVAHNGIPLSRSSVTFVDLLRDAGYATALIGKSHLQNFGADSPRKRAWTNLNGGTEPSPELRDADRDHRRGREYDNEWTPYWEADPTYAVQTPFYGFDHVTLCTQHSDGVQGDYARWLATRHPDPDSLRGRENATPDPRYTAPQAWRTKLPAALYPTTFIAEKTSEWLEKHVESGADQPFYIQCSFPDPHHPLTPPGKYWDLYRPEDMSLPPSFEQSEMPALLKAVHDSTREGMSREGYAPFAVTARECKEMMALTYGMIGLIDDAVGNVLATLSRLSLTDDTVIIFTSDHGEMMGDHGIMLKGPLHYRSVAQVPFIWADPAAAARGRVMPEVASTLDIAQTLLARVGIAPYNGIQGINLLPWLEGKARAVPARPGVMVENEPMLYKFGRPAHFKVKTLFTDRWRVTLSTDAAACEFYDLVADPHEMRNLWDDLSVRAERDALITRMAVEMLAGTDDSPLPTGQA